MNRRIKNALVGAVIAVLVWVAWSFIRHAVLDGSLAFEHIGRAIPVALLGAIAGYVMTRWAPTAHPENPTIRTATSDLSIDTPSLPATDPPGVLEDKNGTARI
jgi:hypothetical protein